VNGDKLDFVIASDAEREDLYADLSYGDEYWAEIVNDPARGVLTIEIFAPRSGNSRIFDLEELQTVLEEAKRRLVELGYPGQG
jgi:hypothetical protein